MRWPAGFGIADGLAPDHLIGRIEQLGLEGQIHLLGLILDYEKHHAFLHLTLKMLASLVGKRHADHAEAVVYDFSH